MIYHKLDGTTSTKFKIGKKGPELQSLVSGQMKIVERDGTGRTIGINDIRLDTSATLTHDIPTVQGVREEVFRKVRTINIENQDPETSLYFDLNGATIAPYDYIYLEKEE